MQFFRFTRGKTWTAGIGQESDCACTGREIVEGLNMLRCSIDFRCIAIGPDERCGALVMKILSGK